MYNTGKWGIMMKKNEYLEFLKRFDKFKKCTLPCSYWDEERQTYEYVWNDKNREINPQLSNNLAWPLEHFTWAELYYSYSIVKTKTNPTGHTHAHAFEEVLRDLYDYPESFNISKEEEEFFSKQELDYLRRIKKYLLFIGLKDCDPFKRVSKTRYYNKKVLKYADCCIYTLGPHNKKNIMSGKQDFITWKYYKEFKPETYDKKEYQALLVDKEDNFLCLIEFTHSKVLKYKDIKHILKIKDEKDNSNIIVRYFKIIEKY